MTDLLTNFNPFFAPAEGVAIVTLEETPVSVVAVASDPELAKVSCADLAPQRMNPSQSGRLVSGARNDQASISNLLTPNLNASSEPARAVSGASKDGALIPEPAPMAPATSLPGVETAAGKTSSAPAAFSFQPAFQPDFEKLFDEIMGQQS